MEAAETATLPQLEVPNLKKFELNPLAHNPLVKEAGVPGHQRVCLSSMGKVLADYQGRLLNHPYLKKYITDSKIDPLAAWQRFIKKIEDVELPEGGSISDPAPALQGEEILGQLAMEFVSAAKHDRNINYGRYSSLRLNPAAKPGTIEAEINDYLISNNVDGQTDGNMAGRIRIEVKGFNMVGKDPKDKSKDTALKAIETDDEKAGAAIESYLEQASHDDPYKEEITPEVKEFQEALNRAIPEQTNDLSDVIVIVAPPLGRDSRSTTVRATIEALEKNNIHAVSFDFPKFEKGLASFENQARWLGEVWWNEHAEMLKGKRIVFYGHSRGELTGRWLMHLYPDLFTAFLGTSGPARNKSRIDGDPPEAAMKLFKFTIDHHAVPVDKVDKIKQRFQNLFPRRMQESFIKYLMLNPQEACLVYQTIVLDEPNWIDLARKALPVLPTIKWYGNKDGALKAFGHRAYLEQDQITVLRHPEMGHGFIPPEYLPRLIKHLVNDAEKRRIQYDPRRLESVG
jgi:hypothetical protein